MAGFETMLDRMSEHRRGSDTADSGQSEKFSVLVLPKTVRQAIGRGVRNRCPSCGERPLFLRFLKPMEHCQTCGQDWTPQQADDFPAYIAIIVTGHIMAPFVIFMVSKTNFPMWINLAIILTLTLVLTASLLQPAKGGVIALQWWMEMNGFKRPHQQHEEIPIDDL